MKLSKLPTPEQKEATRRVEQIKRLLEMGRADRRRCGVKAPRAVLEGWLRAEEARAK